MMAMEEDGQGAGSWECILWLRPRMLLKLLGSGRPSPQQNKLISGQVRSWGNPMEVEGLEQGNPQYRTRPAAYSAPSLAFLGSFSIA